MSDEHYLRAVTELGDTRKVTTTCDIYSESGVKLVSSGIQITSDLYQRLVQHKLRTDLDKSLEIENMLDTGAILADVLELIESNGKLGKVAQVVNQGVSYTQLISELRIPAMLLVKLTVAKEKFPAVYRHDLLMLVLCVYLARCDGMSRSDETCVAVAALFHDIGLLHVDPALLDPSHVMTVAERRHLYAHPMTAYFLLSEATELPKTIADAVLEHHERMDGSGYPRGLIGGKISRYGQILAVNELVTKAFDVDISPVQWSSIEVMLKLSSKKFGKGLFGYLKIFRDDAASVSINEPERLIEQVKLIAILFENFNQHASALCGETVFEFAKNRLVRLQLSLFDAGVDPRDPDGLIRLFMEDPDCMADYAPLLEETLWQFNALVLEVARQWPEFVDVFEGELEKPEHAWFVEMKDALADSESHIVRGMLTQGKV